MTPWQIIAERTSQCGFDMPSDESTRSLLRMLAASKPGGQMLEIGTGTGLATASLLEGMDDNSCLVSIDNDATCQTIARDVFAADPRVEFVLSDGLDFLAAQELQSLDLVFADAWPGKYYGLDKALALVASGGFFICDDMRPRDSWPDDHVAKATALIVRLRKLPSWHLLNLAWGSGFIIAVRT